MKSRGKLTLYMSNVATKAESSSSRLDQGRPPQGAAVEARQGTQHLGARGARDQGGLRAVRRAHGRREGGRHTHQGRAAGHGVRHLPLPFPFTVIGNAHSSVFFPMDVPWKTYDVRVLYIYIDIS